MNSDPRIRDLFDEAVGRPEAERLAFVDANCDDPAIRDEVRRLLDAHARAGNFLADPAIPAERLLDDNGPSIGDKIGPYELTRVLGEGGYGVVFLARQETPVERTVALKIIKAGLDSRQVLARFELERHALSLMDHSCIARVLDAGTDPKGRPYFVMEYVDGTPITDFCRAHQMDVGQRLDLFVQVCRGVQHAHQKGVIHRDLKPANVLVTLTDGQPQPKIIDFGIAKALHGLQSPGITQARQFLGTPQYMSPEQTAGREGQVDTRSDVYALGVLLYELLTGSTPFDGAMMHAAQDEVRRILCETEPPRPSQRLGSSAQTLLPNDKRGREDTRRQAKHLRGDLDWVVMKALDKDRARRYPTAEALAEDVLRHLADEPVSAGPPSAAYRLRKLCRRHRGLLTGVTAVVAALAIGAVVATTGFIKASAQRDAAVRAQALETEQRRIAQEQEALARRNAAQAQAEADRVRAAQLFLYRLLNPVPAEDGSYKLPPRDVLAFVAAKVGDGSLRDHPEVEAPLRAAMGSAYLGHRLYEQAAAEFKRSAELHRQLAPAGDQNVASALHNQGWALLLLGKPAESIPLMRESLAVYEHIDAHDDWHETRALVLQHLITALSATGDSATAKTTAREAVAFARKTCGPNHLRTRQALGQLADILERSGDSAEVAAVRQELARAVQSVLSEPEISPPSKSATQEDKRIGEP